MVYTEKDLKVCHKLTEYGEFAYQKLLQFYADTILFEYKYPIFSKIIKLLDILNIKIKFIDKIYEKIMDKIMSERN